jgi:hypothetical protein
VVFIAEDQGADLADHGGSELGDVAAHQAVFERAFCYFQGILSFRHEVVQQSQENQQTSGILQLLVLHQLQVQVALD